eukprot:comp20424_c0_seq3/m.41018 comp20424_c0_seq3/g.41018  ORF comp20424_c0_seq3/g.41018 comp20424_c0_seq3/m.41018 type:complete len:139 (+) comp20424_c0_seq3:63-479(+)
MGAVDREKYSGSDQSDVVNLGALLTSADLSSVSLEKALEENERMDAFVARFGDWHNFTNPRPVDEETARRATGSMGRDFQMLFKLLVQNRILKNWNNASSPDQHLSRYPHISLNFLQACLFSHRENQNQKKIFHPLTT